MNKTQIGLGFIIGFIFLTIYIGLNNQKFVDGISTAQLPQAILYYIASRVDYLLILVSIIYLKISTPIRDFFGGIFILGAIDIISFPRLPMDVITTDISLMANSDYIFMSKLLNLTHWSYPFAWKFYYIVLPIVLVLGAGYIMGLMKLGKKLFNQGG